MSSLLPYATWQYAGSFNAGGDGVLTPLPRGTFDPTQSSTPTEAQALAQLGLTLSNEDIWIGQVGARYNFNLKLSNSFNITGASLMFAGVDPKAIITQLVWKNTLFTNLISGLYDQITDEPFPLVFSADAFLTQVNQSTSPSTDFMLVLGAYDNRWTITNYTLTITKLN